MASFCHSALVNSSPRHISSYLIYAMPALIGSALFLAVSIRLHSMQFRLIAFLVYSNSFLLYAFRFLVGSIRFYSPLVHFASVPCQFDSRQLIALPSHFHSARFIPNSRRFKSPPFLSDHFVSSSSHLSATLFQINSNLLRLAAVRSISLPFRFFPHQCVSAPDQVRSVPFHSFSILIVSVRRVSVSMLHISCLFRFFSGRVYSLPIPLGSFQFRFRSSRFSSLPVHLGALQRLSMPDRIVSMHFKSESNRIGSDQFQFQAAPRIANSYLLISTLLQISSFRIIDLPIPFGSNLRRS